MGRMLDQGGWPSQPSPARSARERSHPTYGSVTDLVIRFNSGFESRFFTFPTSCLFHHIRQFHSPRLSVMIEIHRVISHKFKSLMGLPSALPPSFHLNA